ncbi:MAG: TSUP family transporter [Fusobacterium sp. JB021]|nr:TSUP family transporter [Fusobacterium sp. JB020]MDP0493983.1 TSUP family transporter [Fusobacterium sp. JB021]MDP0505889.1 TSUP family transporter [Fusobacterium sp. JB019]
MEDMFLSFSLGKFLFLSVACFTGAFVDAIAGGGGIITVPAYIFTGMPIHFALGTNKFSSVFLCLGSSLRYLVSGKINISVIKYPAIISFFASSLGVYTVSRIDDKFLEPVVVILLFLLTVYTFLNKKIGFENTFKVLDRKTEIYGWLATFIVSFYIGFFGPGGGSFLLFAYIKIYGFDFVTASANTKVTNLFACIAAVIGFIILGKVVYIYAIPLSIIMFIGGQIGAKFAIKNGVKVVRPIFMVVCTITVTKLIIEKFL